MKFFTHLSKVAKQAKNEIKWQKNYMGPHLRVPWTMPRLLLPWVPSKLAEIPNCTKYSQVGSFLKANSIVSLKFSIAGGYRASKKTYKGLLKPSIDLNFDFYPKFCIFQSKLLTQKTYQTSLFLFKTCQHMLWQRNWL